MSASGRGDVSSTAEVPEYSACGWPSSKTAEDADELAHVVSNWKTSRHGSSEVMQESEANAVPPLSPERFVNDMDGLASYLAGRGLPLLITGHYIWMTRYLASYFKNNKAAAKISVGLSIPFFPVGLTVSFAPGLGRLTPPTIVLAVAQVFDRLWQLIRSLIVRLAIMRFKVPVLILELMPWRHSAYRGDRDRILYW